MFELYRKTARPAIVIATGLALAFGCKNPTVPADSDDPDEEPSNTPGQSHLAPESAHTSLLAGATGLSVRFDEQRA